MSTEAIVWGVYFAELERYTAICAVASLIPPPPPPPPPPAKNPALDEFLSNVSEWNHEVLLPALEGACSD